MDRDEFRSRSLQDRYNDAVQKLDNERQVRDYLASQGNHGAALRVDRNIEKMTKTVERFGNEIPKKPMN